MKRIFVLYNDTVNCGLSIVADHKPEIDYKAVDMEMEEVVGTLTTPKQILAAVKGFSAMFPALTFLEGFMYTNFQSSEQSETIDDAENEYMAAQRGYMINKPDKTKLVFA